MNVERSPGAGIAGGWSGERVRLTRSRWLFWLPATTVVVGVAITAILVVLTHSVYVRNQHRLLRLRLSDATSIVTVAIPGIQTPLASAAELADATGGNLRKFTRFIAPSVGPGRTFASVSLWRADAAASGPSVVLGATPKLSSAQAAPFLRKAVMSSKLTVMGLLSGSDPRLGYAFAAPGGGQYVAYAESPLTANRVAPRNQSGAFSGLNYAIYLGHNQRPADLLITNVAHNTLPGYVAVEPVPFGDTALTMAMSAEGSLSGNLPRDLPWIIGLAGALLTLAAASGARRLTQRRIDAERLAVQLEVVASENRQLYSEQKTIAQTLQHALLPDTLPQVRGVLSSARYHAGERSVDVGGDWYDLIALPNHRLLLVVGDVSGRGLRAATTMASLRYAIHAYAAQDDPPETILSKLSELISVTDEGQLATVLCAAVDIEAREISVTSAGHLPPLIVSDGGASYAEVPVGLPLGVEARTHYTPSTVRVPPGATVLGFTDGLVERRGENLDQGLARLRDAAAATSGPLPQVLDKLVEDLSGGHSQDDIAILGLRWTS